jgi:arylsulfatase A-like enzyme
MKALASQGVTFSHCISNYPVCSPHRAILMTGRWPYQQGVIDNNIALRSEEMTLGKAFKAAGYKTGYIGKWHLGGLRAEPFGFDLSLIWTEIGTHWDRSRFHPREGEPVQPKGYNATLMTDQALDFIEENRERPFFLVVSWNPPHSDFLDPPEGKKDLYPVEDSLPRRKNVVLESPPVAEENASIFDRNGWPHFQGYNGHISAIDDELGRIMKKVDGLGLSEDTIIVYSSDHGSMMGSHGLGSKRQPYEESIRVPFLVRWPGVIPAGIETDTLFGSIDIMPTLCAIAGIPVPESCMGQDFSPLLRGEKGPDPDHQFIMHVSKKNASNGDNHPAPLFRGIRTKRYTYAYYPEKPWCLFDNQEDPYQLNNLINDPEKASLRKELDEILRKSLDEAEDPFTLAMSK